MRASRERCVITYTYRGLLLPHLDVLPLRLSEVIPDLLVAGRSKDSFDLTDCVDDMWSHVAYKKNTTNPPLYIPFDTLISSVVSSLSICSFL